MLDTRITGGTIVDGTGSPGFAGDVGIRDGRIVAVGTVTEAAREEIDASGRVVAPGFIDAHTHYDAQVFWDPKLTPSCFHGVTTVIGGFCGFSIAPLTPDSGPYIRRMLSRVEGMPLETLEAVSDWGWSSFGDYLDRVEGGLGLNAGFFVGHSAIRRAVMGPRAVGEAATAAEITAMQDLLDRSLAEGALGFSTTTSPTHNDYEGQPVPSRWAEREEFLALASVVAKHEGTGLELLPDLEKLEATADLMAEFSLAGQRPVNWNVLVVNGKANAAEIAARQLSISDTARARGGEVIALTMPRTPGVYMSLKNGMMFDVLPGLWREVFKLPIQERIAKFRDPEVRRQLAADAELIPADSGLKSFA
ncbi:MAG TPA: amidohydrolase family protein, partial [Novosphingobium sp.]